MIATKGKYAIGAALLIGALLYFSGFIEGFVSGFEGHPGLPSCDWSRAKDDAKRAWEGAHSVKLAGLTIISVSDPKPVSASREKVACNAKVRLNSGATGTIDYSFSLDPSVGAGHYLARAQVSDVHRTRTRTNRAPRATPWSPRLSAQWSTVQLRLYALAQWAFGVEHAPWRYDPS